MVSLLAAAALAAGTDSRAEFVPDPVAGRPVFDFRAGLSSTDAGSHPYLCAEGAPAKWLTVDLCGTGSGFLHHGTEPDMAHFRARTRVTGVERGRFGADAMIGLGFAEIQRGVDPAGFRFGTPDGETTNGAGPEASLGGKARAWIDPRAYTTLDVTGGVAHIPAAPAVIGQSGPWVPFVAATVGLGF